MKQLQPDTTTTESPSTRTMPLYRVLLHNDPVNTMEHVVTTLVQIFGLQIEAAIQIMLEAHNSEVALCKVEPLEPAELHWRRARKTGPAGKGSGRVKQGHRSERFSGRVVGMTPAPEDRGDADSGRARGGS